MHGPVSLDSIFLGTLIFCEWRSVASKCLTYVIYMLRKRQRIINENTQ